MAEAGRPWAVSGPGLCPPAPATTLSPGSPEPALGRAEEHFTPECGAGADPSLLKSQE